jgi:hypothetical protein
MKPMLLALLSLAWFSKDGSGKVVSDHRVVKPFEEISISGTVEVSIEVDDEPTVRIDTDDNLQQYVTTEVSGKRLIIKQTENLDPTRLAVVITVPKLTKLDASGATETKIKGLHGDRFELDVSGAADVELEGEVDLFIADASGAAEVDAEKLEAERVELDGSGACDFSVHATDELVVSLSGAGSVEYRGDPDEVKTDLSGAASIRKR